MKPRINADERGFSIFPYWATARRVRAAHGERHGEALRQAQGDMSRSCYLVVCRRVILSLSKDRALGAPLS